MRASTPIEFKLSHAFKPQHTSTIRGETVRDPYNNDPKCHSLLGIPYAYPPRRWHAPEALPAGHSYQRADSYTYFQPSCPQLERPSALRQAAEKLQMSEDCLYVNIWIPAGPKPVNGWPVYFYIHGGFLQYGSPNLAILQSPEALLHLTSIQSIFVLPCYRLGVLGFLASSELTAGNFGFQDQRCALEWTHNHIASLGGNPSLITVGGYSAGAYSAAHQLAHDLLVSPDPPIIKQVVLQSNGIGVSPKSISEAQSQFTNLVAAARIPSSATSAEKLSRLRALPVEQLLQIVAGLSERTAFKPVLDDIFIHSCLFTDIDSGALARAAKLHGVRVLAGSVTAEENLYGNIQPPRSRLQLVERLALEYPRLAVETVLPLYAHRMPVVEGEGTHAVWQKVFSSIYSDLQVYATQRGLLQSLASELPLTDIWRYEIDWRARCVDAVMSREMGITHTTDSFVIWFFNVDSDFVPKQGLLENAVQEMEPGPGGLNVTEQGLIMQWLEPFGAFLRGENDHGQWGTKDTDEVRVLTREGVIVVKKDGRWEEGLRVWRALRDVPHERPI